MTIFDFNIKYEQLIEFALELVSDVPFFIKSKPAVGKSRGEILEFVDLEIKQPILIVNPNINIATSDAFQFINPREINFDLKSAVKNNGLDYSFLRTKIVNDFEPYVFSNYKEIKKIKEDMYIKGAEFALMSGSGSTVFGIFQDLESAENMQKSLPSDYFSVINYNS